MTEYRISGVWKDSKNVITHYAFHTVITAQSVTRAVKKSKAEAIKILESKENIAKTWIWNYSTNHWVIGGAVSVINGTNGKYLRSNHDNKLADNLAHLINFDWIAP